MPLLPPELARPFRTRAERDAARDRLRQRDRILRYIETLGQKPEVDWTSRERDAFPNMTNGISDPPPRRVARWATLFAEELAEIHKLATLPRPLSDIELQEAVYLAGRLLSTVTERSIAEVDSFTIV